MGGAHLPGSLGEVYELDDLKVLGPPRNLGENTALFGGFKLCYKVVPHS